MRLINRRYMQVIGQKSKLILLVLLSAVTNVVWADTPAAAHGGGAMSSMLMVGVIFLMMYFLMIRPQSKKAKQHKELISNISNGDEVLTQAGILAKVVKNTDSFFILAINNVEFPVQKQAVIQLLPKGTIKSICDDKYEKKIDKQGNNKKGDKN